MKMITIHETENTLQAIDNLVRRRVFNSRAEAYRAGALLMITVSSARRLALADRLDAELYAKAAQACLSMMQKGKLDSAREELMNLEEGLRLKAILSRVNGDDMEGIETIADGFGRYAEALSRAGKLDTVSRQRLMKDLSRDLKAVTKLQERTKD
jgi:Arc/MetJ-type ribon-helix-helix transcriptional regulator